jgi:hypothetical protein
VLYGWGSVASFPWLGIWWRNPVPPTKKAIERAKIVRVERRKRVLGRIGKGLGVLITLFGIYTGWIAIKTRISMSSDSPVNPSDIMSAPFVVSNDGALDLHDVSYGCVNRKVLSDMGTTVIAQGPYPKWMGGFTTKSMVANLIPPTGKQAFTCPMPLIPSGHVTYGDVIIAVSYRPDWWPFKRQIQKRFATALDSQRKPIRWYEQPMPKQ